jgi:hypothetical protein
MAVQPVERKLAAIFAADRNRSLPTFDASLDECRAERNGTPACDSMKAIGTGLGIFLGPRPGVDGRVHGLRWWNIRKRCAATKGS